MFTHYDVSNRSLVSCAVITTDDLNTELHTVECVKYVSHLGLRTQALWSIAVASNITTDNPTKSYGIVMVTVP